MIINIEKRYAFIIFGLLVSAVGIFLVYALTPWDTGKTVWHEGSDVKVQIGSDYTSLQDAIDEGSFGGGGESIPSGFCIFSRTQTGCPSGWSRDSGFDSRTIRGSASLGGIGGSDSHSHTGPSHTHAGTTGYLNSGDWTARGGEGYSAMYNVHTHSFTTGASGTGPTSSTSSWPPYTNVIICCKN